MPSQRKNLAYLVRRGVQTPQRILPYFRRLWRNYIFNRTSGDQLEAHRRFIEDLAAENPNAAVGSDTIQHWLNSGELQFNHLVQSGVKPGHRVLDLGCGNLRLGWRLIRYLDAAKYFGIEIAPRMLQQGRAKVVEYNLQDKWPYLLLVDDIDYRFLPAKSFDCITCHAVFVNSALGSIARVVPAITHLLKPGGFFDFTYYEVEGKPYAFQGAYYYHRREDIVEIVAKTGLYAEYERSWDPGQVRVRLTYRPS
jgi:SAM-dependent methyltransferase